MPESPGHKRAAERLSVSNKPCFPGKKNKHEALQPRLVQSIFLSKLPVLCTGLAWQLSALILPEREGCGLGDETLENDEMEGRQGRGECITRRMEEFRRLEHEGALFTLAGLAQNPGGRGAQAKTAEEQRRNGSPGQLCRPCWKDRATHGGGQRLLWRDGGGQGSWRAQRTHKSSSAHFQKLFGWQEPIWPTKLLFCLPAYPSPPTLSCNPHLSLG